VHFAVDKKSGVTAILILALRKRNFNRAGTETRPYPPKITDNQQIFTVFVEATRQLSVVAPKLVKIRISPMRVLNLCRYPRFKKFQASNIGMEKISSGTFFNHLRLQSVQSAPGSASG